MAVTSGTFCLLFGYRYAGRSCPNFAETEWSRGRQLYLQQRNQWYPHPHLSLRTAYLLSNTSKHDKAVKLFAKLDKAHPIEQEMVLNYLATSFAKTNAPDVAKHLVERSLARDPDQFPMHLYLDRLRSGPRVAAPIRPELPISICIYTYNKADLLETTLQSVCASDIGEAYASSCSSTAAPTTVRRSSRP